MESERLPTAPQTSVLDMRGTVRLLGAIGYFDAAGAEVELRSAGQRRLLGLLAVAAGDVQRADYLADVLDIAPAGLRTAISRLRSLIGEDAIATEGAGYRITTPVDTTGFERLVGGPALGAARLDDLHAALELWHGSALDEFAHEPWAVVEAARLNELRLVASEDQAELLTAVGRGGEAVAALEALTAANPHRDRPWGLLMQALAVQGRQADSLQVFQNYRGFLAEETGTEPSASVREIEQRILAGEENEQRRIIDRLSAAGNWPEEEAAATPQPEGSEASGPTLPTGVVTFLFTDVEGSSAFWATDPEAMASSLRVHDQILRQAIRENHGRVITTAGDSFAAAFQRASDATAAAAQVQAALAATKWTGPALLVRMGLHLGETEERDGDYFGPVVNLTARLEAAGHGGQTLLSDQVVRAAGLHQSETLDLGTHRLRDISDPVHIHQLGSVTFPSLRTVARRQGNLPVAASNLIGRDNEVAEVQQALADTRLVTLTATGGMGKTRLALAVGEAELPHRRDGVWFVDLTTVTEEAQIPVAIANATGLVIAPGETAPQVVDFLTNLEALLVLDNCEHVVDGCADFLDLLLARPTATTVLATSREYFDIDGQQVIHVSPLAAVDAESPAVQLFIERATAVRPDFVADEAAVTTIVDLCERLDGLPLAIELAAARSSVLSPSELLTGIDDRFRILHGGRRRQRQRTLELTLEWSYNLLDPDEQACFRSLGVFVGTFDADAVASVAGVSRLVAIDLIESLLAKSLIDRVDLGDSSRFRLLETTAAYAEQRLAAAEESEAARDRHLQHYHQLNAHREAGSLWWDHGSLDLFQHDRSNILAAFDWGTARDQWRTAGELLAGTLRVLMADDREALRLIDRTIAALDDPDDELVLELHESRTAVAVFAHEVDESIASIQALRQSTRPSARLHGQQVNTFLLVGRPEKARRLLNDADDDLAALQTDAEISRGQRFHRVLTEMILLFEGNYVGALESSEAAVAAWDGISDDEAIVQSARTATVCHLILDQPDRALAAAERTTNVRSLFGSNSFHLALSHIALGGTAESEQLLADLAHHTTFGRVRFESGSMLLVFAALAHAENDEANARRLLMTTPNRRSIELYAYSDHLAERLGIRSQYAALSRKYRGLPDVEESHSRRCIEAVRAEMARRNWNR